MERGEVAGRCSWSWSSLMSQRPDWIRDKRINLLVLASNKRHPDIPAEVPLIMDFARNDADRTLLEIFLLPQVMGRPYFLPDGVPAERVAALRKAFDETAKDPGMAADFKRLKLELSPVSGEEIQAMLTRVYATPPEVIARARDAMRYKGEKVTAKPTLSKVNATIVQSIREGRQVEVKLADGKTAKASISTSSTEVTIGGKKAKRAALKAGMACAIEWPGPGQQATKLDCK
jgi:hypothetical protein